MKELELLASHSFQKYLTHLNSAKGKIQEKKVEWVLLRHKCQYSFVDSSRLNNTSNQ